MYSCTRLSSSGGGNSINGNELVAPDYPLQPGQIVDSNQYALATLVAQSGAEPLLLGIVPDEPNV